jgi:hypothetical protein
MRARLAWLGAAAGVIGLAGGCGSGTRVNPPEGSFDAGRPAIDAAAPADAGDAGPATGGDASDGGDGGDGASAGDAGDAGADDAGDGGGVVDAGPPLCAGKSWNTASPTKWITGVHRFGGITPDELTIAWTSDASTIWVASRQVLTDSFATPYTSVSTATAPIADDRIALAPSGLTIVAVAPDRSTFVEFANQSGTWSAAPSDPFVNLEAMAMDGPGQFFEPMLGADGNFYYLLAPLGTNAGAPTMYQSTWNGSQRAWNTGIALTDTDLASHGLAMRRRPTGATEDGRTLFFFDEVAGFERQATRDQGATTFSAFADLAAFPEAAPGGRCVRLYFVTGTGASAAISSQR